MAAAVDKYLLPPLYLNEGRLEWCSHCPALIQPNAIHNFKKTAPFPAIPPKHATEKISRRNYKVHGLVRGESFSSDSSVPPMVEDQYATSDSDMSVEEDGYQGSMPQRWGDSRLPAQRSNRAPGQHPESVSRSPPQTQHTLTSEEPATPVPPERRRPHIKRPSPAQCSLELPKRFPPASPCPRFPPPSLPAQQREHPGASALPLTPPKRPASRPGHIHQRNPSPLTLFPLNNAGLPSDVHHHRPSTAPSSRVNGSFSSSPTPPLPCTSPPLPSLSPERSVFEYDSDDERRTPQPSLAARLHIRNISGGDRRLSHKDKEKRKDGARASGIRSDAIGQSKEAPGEEKKKKLRRSAEKLVKGFLGLGRR